MIINTNTQKVMKITILTTGSRGDVQPFIALAQALKNRGDDVLLAAPPNFEQFVTEHGISFCSLGIDLKQFLNEPEARAAIDSGNIIKQLRWRQKHINELFIRTFEDAWKVSQGSDLLIFKSSISVGPGIATRLNIPCVEVGFIPLTATRYFPCALMKNQRNSQNAILSRFRKLASAAKLNFIMWQLVRGIVNKFRVEVLQIAPIPFWGENFKRGKLNRPTIYAYSPIVLPKPKDWPEHIHVVGNWFLRESNEWIAPEHLIKFIEAGSPPVCFGFGSMTRQDPEETTLIIVNALKRTNQRGIILGGWSEIGLKQTLPDFVLALPEAPHEWLFPKMAAVVHHGGAGTTAAALKAGIPSVIVPHLGDQPFWAERLYESGLAAKPLDIAMLSAKNLAERITAATTDLSIKANTTAVKEKMKHESSIVKSLEIIDEYITKFQNTL